MEKDEILYKFKVICEKEYDEVSSMGRVLDPSQYENRKEWNFIPNNFGEVFGDLHYITTNLISPVGRFDRTHSFLFKGNTTKFLDIGCGVGNVMRLANNFGFHSYGLEKNPKLIEFGMKHFHSSYFKKDDIIDYKGYDEPDVIYFYRPFKEQELQLKLEEKIIKDSKKSVIFMAYFTAYDGTFSELKKIQGTHGVYVKK